MSKKKGQAYLIVKGLIHRLIVVLGAVELTLAFFLVLPLMQTLTREPTEDLVLQEVHTIEEAPDPPPEPEQQEEPEPEEEPPELMEEAPPLDLAQLELALNPGVSGGFLEGDFTVNLTSVVSKTKDVDELFSIADLDQKPRVVYQPSPVITGEVRKRAPGTVHIIFIVDKNGRVEKPIVQNSTDPVFEKPALNAIKQWKFEPGKRNGEPVRFRMRVPITFPKGL